MPSEQLRSARFPRASKYHPDWVLAAMSGGANSLWLTEWLAEALELRPSMRVLDLGCGRGASSIFLRREFGVQVFAADLWFDATERFQRIQDAGVEDGCSRSTAMPARCRSRPSSSTRWFRSTLSLTTAPTTYTWGYLARFVKPGGPIAIGCGAYTGNPRSCPRAPQIVVGAEYGCLHSPGWWRHHSERTGIVDVRMATRNRRPGTG
jgi:hypothetical protein